eukprot:gene8772-8951_t
MNLESFSHMPPSLSHARCPRDVVVFVFDIGKPAGVDEDGECQASDEQIVFVDMVEESKKRARPRSSTTPPGQHTVAHCSRAAAARDSGQHDAFAAFATKYRDVLQFADADEAEAVYSMVSLTQAAAPGWLAQKPAAKLPPPGGFFPSMMGCSMPPFMPPFMPPWAVPPGMMPLMFGNMGISMMMPPAGLPSANSAGMYPPPLMVPGLPGLPGSCPTEFPAHVSGVPAVLPMPGLPVSGMPFSPAPSAAPGVPSATHQQQQPQPKDVKVQCKSQHVQGKRQQASKQLQDVHHPAAVKLSAAHGVAASATVAKDAGSAAASPRAASPPAASPWAAPAVEATLPAGTIAAAALTEAKPATTAPGRGLQDIYSELEQLDVVALKPWVVSHFCEDVYLLLLDVWRPDSAKVRDAVWAWKLHVKAPLPAGSAPDYRAFLVSLFGLERLEQLTTSSKAGQQAQAAAHGPVPPPVFFDESVGGQPFERRTLSAVGAHGTRAVRELVGRPTSCWLCCAYACCGVTAAAAENVLILL